MSTVIPIKNVWHMLLYAWDMAQWRGRWDAEIEEAPRLLGLLGRILAETTRPLVRHELGRAFVERDQLVRGVRGRIDFDRSLKRLAFEAGSASCRFPALEVDTARNRIIRWTAHRVARDPALDHAKLGGSEKLRHDLREIVFLMEGVTLTPVTNAAFRTLQLGRADREYALPLAICRLLHERAMPTETAGDAMLTSLLKDEVAFPSLFERFVRNFWRHHLHDHHVTAEGLEWPEIDHPLMPAMRTDIVLTSRRTPHRRLVVDTKFYGQPLASTRFGGRKFHSGNVYQMYAYLRTQEARGEEFQRADGMLLYPTVQEEVDQTIVVQGHRIRFVTINLNRAWQEIEARLSSLAVAPSTVPLPSPPTPGLPTMD